MSAIDPETIDTTLPPAVAPTTSGVRGVFAAIKALFVTTKAEIEALASDVTDAAAAAADAAAAAADAAAAAADAAVVAASAGWQAWGSFNRWADSTFTVVNASVSFGVFYAGRPIRYRGTAGTWRYGIVTGIHAGVVTIAGAPMTAADDDELEFGDQDKVFTEYLVIPGRFADAASTTLLKDDLLFQWLWGAGPCYLVQIAGVCGTADTAATDYPRVNARNDGTEVCTANSGEGIEVNAAWADSGVSIDTAEYECSFGKAIEVSTDAHGTNDDSTDLTLRLVFIRGGVYPDPPASVL